LETVNIISWLPGQANCSLLKMPIPTVYIPQTKKAYVPRAAVALAKAAGF
jgi:hypothetical protein